MYNPPDTKYILSILVKVMIGRIQKINLLLKPMKTVPFLNPDAFWLCFIFAEYLLMFVSVFDFIPLSV